MEAISDLLSNAIAHHQNGQLPIAEQLYLRILDQNPRQPDAIHLMGVIAHQTGYPEISIDYIRRAIAFSGDTPNACCNLGIAYQAARRIPEAIDCYRRALSLKWDDVETHLNLGVALKSVGRSSEAIASYRQALQLNPACVQALNNLGIELKEQGNFEEAESYFSRAIELCPTFAEVHNNLGNLFQLQGQLDAAVECYRRAIALKPDYVEAHNNLGNPLKDQGQIEAAIACFRRVIELEPGHAVAHSNLVYTQVFLPEVDGTTLLQELRKWNMCHARPLRNSEPEFSHDRSQDRRLKIGYVSPDFRDHCQSLFTIPLFTNHDRRSFEITCYSAVSRPDSITDRLRSAVDHWVDITTLDHDQVSQQIRDDRIDILVDLTMHMAGNRLLTFARRPAPVQVCWLAYPGNTGLETMDYRISDPYLDPDELGDPIDSERTIRLPETFWCYDPLDSVTTVNPLPAFKNGYVTFGCLNNFCKVNRDVLSLWSRVLRQVETSRLMILAAEGQHRQMLLEQMKSEGVANDRIQFVPLRPRSEYLWNYHAIDLCLDTLPYNGHTTSLDAMWMGVPVVTLVGTRIVGRAGLSQLTNLGLTDLIARSPEQFVSIATNLARDWSRLNELRSSLRMKMQASALMDASRFARNIESIYRQVWRHWCASPDAEADQQVILK